jgi:hyperosmotically inducible periplasmic protein
MFRARITGLVGAVVLAVATVACSQSDPGITTAVKSKLAADDTVKAYRIDVDTKDRVVTLSGNVDTPAAKARAVELARGTDGVRDVVDNTTVVAGVTPPGGIDDATAATTGRAADKADAKTDEAQAKAREAGDRAGDATSDAAITTKVKSKFLADTSISGLKIDVDTTNHVVTLTGTVPTAAEKTRAVAVAKGTDGVKSVIDRLKVGK